MGRHGSDTQTDTAPLPAHTCLLTPAHTCPPLPTPAHTCLPTPAGPCPHLPTRTGGHCWAGLLLRAPRIGHCSQVPFECGSEHRDVLQCYLQTPSVVTSAAGTLPPARVHTYAHTHTHAHVSSLWEVRNPENRNLNSLDRLPLRGRLGPTASCPGRRTETLWPHVRCGSCVPSLPGRGSVLGAHTPVSRATDLGGRKPVRPPAQHPGGRGTGSVRFWFTSLQSAPTTSHR